MIAVRVDLLGEVGERFDARESVRTDHPGEPAAFRDESTVADRDDSHQFTPVARPGLDLEAVRHLAGGVLGVPGSATDAAVRDLAGS